ncbi:YeiH family protein [Desulfurobacterium atlanticum]|uniref:Conserved hypothetical integral membrane protein n=1 Tax=Desulfurobacterium atlanticum TaxID=240169 RepID=A0A239A4X8_9BACT|nr:putative sulfate exporter family transporter [Desulfurobacterium atlanticum]SNR90138.1 conserved hypothetical integral membrane protein [Desulfurobacterium atlanticum]
MIDRKIIDGLTACVIVAVISILFGKLLPSLGADSFAILLGIIAGNTLAKDKRFQPGVKFAESKILALAIALLGIGLNLNALIKVGIKGILLVLLLVPFVILTNYIIGRLLGFSEKFSLLMGTGNAVCGSSAIAAVAPILKAEEDEVGIPVAVVNLVGTISMFLLPILALKVFHYDVIKTGALIGGGLQSVGQVVVAGSFVSIEAARYAILFKMARVLMIGVIAVVFSYIFAGEGTESTKKKFSVPPFIIAFFLLSVIGSSGYLPVSVIHLIKLASEYLLVVAIAGIGMRIKFSELLKEGPLALLFGISASVLQIAFLIILIHVLF